MNKDNAKTKRNATVIAVTALFTAMNIAMSSFGIPVPGGHFYLCDAVICLGALLLDPLSAFIIGGVGSFLGDMIFYPAPMFVSLITHGLQAVVISVISHYVLKKKPLLSAIIAVTAGAIIMIVGYSLGRAYVYATPEYAWIKLPYEVLQAGVGAVVGVLLAYKFGIKKAFSKIFAKKI